MTAQTKANLMTDEISHMAYPAYASMWNRLQELRASLTSVDAEINAMLSMPRAKTDAAKARIARLLGDPVAPRGEFALDSAKIAERVDHRQDIRNAIQELERRLGEEQNVIDAEICARIKPEHDRLAADVGTAIIALLGPLVAYQAFADKLNEAGVAWSGRLHPSHFRAVGNPTQRDGHIALYLNEIAKSGIIAQELIPAELRHEWPPTPKAAVVRAPTKLRAVRSSDTADTKWSEVA